MKYTKGYKYQLEEDESIQLPEELWPEEEIKTDYILITVKGLMTVKRGYAWDGCSGPTIDRKTNMRAGLFHDPLYQLIRMCKLPVRLRKAIDQFFKGICKTDGMNRFSRRLYFRGVRVGGKGSAIPGKTRKVYTAP